MFTSFRFDRFSAKAIKLFVIFTALYFLWFVFAIGIHSNNISLYLGITALYFINGSTRKFLYCFAPFFIFLVLYDSLRALHRLNLFEIHTQDLYYLDKTLFHLTSEGKQLSLNEYFLQNRNSVLDFLSGAFYLTWVPFPILFGLYLFVKKRFALVFNFWLCFLITNLIGFVGYICYPAAPPWYYLEFGAQIIKETSGQAAGLAWFDEIIGIPIFTNMYTQSAYVFGAMPSLHAAYPIVLSFYSMQYKNKILTAIFLCSVFGIWFGAIYTTHHYALDILMGILCAVLGITITERFLVSKLEIPSEE